MPKKLEDCVKDVMKQGHDESSAYAICNASLNKKKSLTIPVDDVLEVASTAHDDWEPVEVEHGEPKGTIVSIPIPMDIAETIAVIGGEPPEEMHITLAYIDVLSDSELEGLHIGVKEAARCFEPFNIQVGGVGRFIHEDSDVIYASIDSAALDDFRHDLLSHHMPLDVYVSKEHGFTPHITLQYVDKNTPTPRPSEDIKQSWLATHVEVWHNNMRYSYPLSREDWEPIF